MGILNDDQKRHRLVGRLKARARQYREMLDSLPHGVVVQEAGQIRYANYTAARLVGAASQSQLVGKRYADMVLSAAPLGRGHVEQQTLRRADGGIAEVEATTRIVKRGERRFLHITLRELSAPRHTEQQLRQAQRMEAVGRLASGIAHDFNNLLTAIQGHAQFLTEDLEPEHPSRADVEEILHSSERAASLTRQLLAFSRGQAIQPETVKLNTIVTAMERLLRRVISEDIVVDSILADKLWTVRADPTQIEQVLVNLIVNARDAMPRGGQITIKTANSELSPAFGEERADIEPGDYVMLAISDTGVGMSRETQARIFEPFFTTKGPDHGTGLGLSTVFGIIKQMNGHIFVYSEPGHGTTFKLYLPRADSAQPHRPVTIPRGRPGSNEGVLIVEDDDSVRALARRVLESRGYRVWACPSAEQALQIMKEFGLEMSLLISDIVLPGVSGQQLAEQIRESWPDLGVLFMSGYTDDDVRRYGMIAHDEHFIEKPFTPEALARRARAVLDESRLNLPQNRL